LRTIQEDAIVYGKSRCSGSAGAAAQEAGAQRAWPRVVEGPSERSGVAPIPSPPSSRAHRASRSRATSTPSLPSRDAVVEITNLLRELIFPGYFGKQDLRTASLSLHVGELVASGEARALRAGAQRAAHDASRKGSEIPDCDEAGGARGRGLPEHHPGGARDAGDGRPGGLRRRTRRPRTRTRSSSPTRAFSRSPSIAWHTSCTRSGCR